MSSANVKHDIGPDGYVQLTERADGDTKLIEIVDGSPGFGSTSADNRSGIGPQITQELLAECGWPDRGRPLPSGQALVRLLLPIITDGRVVGGGV